jgi:hypothetical protein
MAHHHVVFHLYTMQGISNVIVYPTAGFKVNTRSSEIFIPNWSVRGRVNTRHKSVGTMDIISSPLLYPHNRQNCVKLVSPVLRSITEINLTPWEPLTYIGICCKKLYHECVCHAIRVTNRTKP